MFGRTQKDLVVESPKNRATMSKGYLHFGHVPCGIILSDVGLNLQNRIV